MSTVEAALIDLRAAGVEALLRRHAHGDATVADLVEYWSIAAECDLRGWAAQTLTAPAAG